ncbi:MAG TPA: DUF4105 domain-containing protein [Caulobacterales bacterium]|nr:DUF4105 domain-containing protein [Caulobacterales bacterium]
MKRLARWFSSHPLRPALAMLLAISLLGCSHWAWSPPRADRQWYPYLARTPHVQMDAARFSVSPVTQWTYDAAGPVTQTYADAHFAFSDLRNVWFVLEPQPGMTYAAHTFLLFEFGGDRLLGVTIEARREEHEEYSAIDGAFNAYELAYLWGGSRDLLTRRAVMLNHEVFIYPIRISEEQKRVLLTRLLQRTDDLERRPRFYNTLFSNCTNELAKATDLKWHYSYILTGYSDEHLFEIGLIPGPDFATAHARSDMSAFVRGLNAHPPADFDAAVLAELRRRNAPVSPPALSAARG